MAPVASEIEAITNDGRNAKRRVGRSARPARYLGWSTTDLCRGDSSSSSGRLVGRAIRVARGNAASARTRIVNQSATDTLPNPERVYLQEPTPEGADTGTAVLRLIHPLILYDANLDEVFFLNSRRGNREVEYLCYSTGQVVKREELGAAQRELLSQVIGETVDGAKGRGLEPAYAGRRGGLAVEA